jgi:hypothetical protein
MDRDSLTEAWGNGLCATLPALSKALFSAGRFVSYDDGVASSLCPRRRIRTAASPWCRRWRALTAHFGVTGETEIGG